MALGTVASSLAEGVGEGASSSGEGMGAEHRGYILHMPQLVVQAAQHETQALKIPA